MEICPLIIFGLNKLKVSQFGFINNHPGHYTNKYFTNTTSNLIASRLVHLDCLWQKHQTYYMSDILYLWHYNYSTVVSVSVFVFIL